MICELDGRSRQKERTEQGGKDKLIGRIDKSYVSGLKPCEVWGVGWFNKHGDYKTYHNNDLPPLLSFRLMPSIDRTVVCDRSAPC